MDNDGDDAMHQDMHEANDYRRIEVITGHRKRRSWTAKEKTEIVAATVAGAALIERLSSAVENSGGRISSSRLDVEGQRWGPGFLSAEASLDIEEADLQKLLYDIEAGLPFLYVSELAIQSGTVASDSAGGRLKVGFTVYGRWQGAP
ncbi:MULTISPECIES: type II secretion system protein GspM [Xanthobacter]|uniref:type II secretion system protein GspM n=1 Tax=Xanthobacter TaxID=279 RepID=UPI0024A75808|nr:type II secretion system protein GspM [Xanthobacter autotrophicus]MDI4659059.1 type II secretion system protein M [Xanthobacter autotrophicus]MDI4665511.1 type II secretion system protein M [Xanthobacter autotrophicus]